MGSNLPDWLQRGQSWVILGVQGALLGVILAASWLEKWWNNKNGGSDE